MEIPSYLIAFLLILTPVSTVCVSVMDDRVFDEYSLQIENYEERISELENEVAYLKNRTEIEETQPVVRAEQQDVLLPMLSSLLTEPQQGLNLVDYLTKDMPEKNPALMELSSSNNLLDLFASVFISLVSIVINSLKFVILHMDFVVDFTGRFVSYIFTGFLTKLRDGTLFYVITGAINLAIKTMVSFFAFLPLLLKSLPQMIFTISEYLPRALAYFSIMIKNLPMFFIYFSPVLFSLLTI
jgi:hypothetical protein